MKVRLIAMGLIALGAIALGIITDAQSSSLPLKTPPLQVAQSRAPRLISAYATNDTVWVRHSRYYFSIELPPTVLNPVQKIQLQQRTGIRQISLRPEESIAFLGTSRRKGEVVDIANIEWNRDQAQIELILAEPVQASKIVTVGLRPVRNPRYSGEYSFGVTVFANPEAEEGLYLGPGRLHFYARDFDFRW
ncbi:MAG: DUF2808 domain-containing protein [Cyanobacteria bacterium P01_G01_bin.54]